MEYTREQLEAMPAGRELDALIEERLFGRAVTRNWPCMLNGDDGSLMPKVRSFRIGGCYPYKEPTIGRGYNREVIPCYSVDMAAAWLAAEQFHGQRQHVAVTSAGLTGWVATVVAPDTGGEVLDPWPTRYRAGAPTAPLAICRAALLAATKAA